jgi:uncharacterized protein (TIGR00251 family)
MEGNKTNIRIKVLPRSSKNKIFSLENGIFKVKLSAPPVEGKANRALIDFLAGILGLPKGNIEIVSGKRSRLKSVRIAGCSLEEVEDLLSREI